MTPEDNGRRRLRHAAERAASHPFYLAYALAVYQQSESLDDASLARFLGCQEADLPLLALCRRPGAVGEDEFGVDVAQIVSRHSVRRERLIHLLRQVEFLHAAQGAPALSATFNPQPHSSLLLAAQDRESNQGIASEDDEEML
jgi:hypothetical protein